jgi:hypothetical protein
MIKLPCCNALSTRNRAFELTPTSSRGLLLGVNEPSHITPRGRKFDVTFCNNCGGSWAKARRGSLAVPWSLLRLTLLLRSSDYGDIPFQILNLLNLGLCPCPGSQNCFRWRVNKPKNQNRCRIVQPEWDMSHMTWYLYLVRISITRLSPMADWLTYRPSSALHGFSFHMSHLAEDIIHACHRCFTASVMKIC